MTNRTPTITRDGVLGFDGTEVIAIDQATGAELARYPVAGEKEATAAVAAAREVAGAWWDLGFDGRAQRLRAWQREIARAGEDVAALIHTENGKPVDDARSEVLATVASVYDTFVEKISDLARSVRVGSDDAAQIGPVPLASQIPVIRKHIEDALARGATATVGGPETVASGRYVAPTILIDVPADAPAATEETFGPTLAVVKVADTEQAIALINAGPYGLGSAVFSRDRGEAIARRLRVGMTSINDALVFSMNPALPFGGRGDSGYGRKHGEEGLREFAYPHAFSAKTGPARISASTFDRPAGAMTHALAATRDRLLAPQDTNTA